MAKPGALTEYHLTDHARSEMARRQIAEADIAKVLSAYRTSKIEKYWRAEA